MVSYAVRRYAYTGYDLLRGYHANNTIERATENDPCYLVY